jgi:branched-subunit amino acid ABC-type transport system permease component
VPPGILSQDRLSERERIDTMQALYAQLLVGLINGSFYALLSLGLAVIFGMLNIINFAHGALYMMGAFVAYFLLNLAGINYWWALILAPVIVGASASCSSAPCCSGSRGSIISTACC